MAQHPIVHVEIPANDPQAAAAFYADLFGWQTETNATNDYSMFQAAPGPGGGFPKVDGEYVRPGAVVISVETDDIDATLTKAEELGATVIEPKAEVPGIGWFAVFVDPTGNRIALWMTMTQD
mgnify:FL=1